ncbi:MAG TPA: hypothetical protein VJQ44_07965 [Gemmatimonadales bacterium]|nr:hypothetical protein [Gemmatimonadales bacterium]
MSKQPTKYKPVIEQLRRLAREPFEVPDELRQLRRRIETERDKTHHHMVERLAKETKVDIQGLFDEHRRRNAAQRRYVRQALQPLEARALAEAKAEKARFHKTRSAYQELFAAGLPAATALPPQLKFKRPVDSSSTFSRADCNKIIGGLDPDAGAWEASADLTDNGDAGVWLYPYIYTDTGDCDDSKAGQTLQDLSYAMSPPAQSFYVSSVRVDLVGNGLASSVLGDFKWPTKADPLYEHTYVQLDVWVAQEVNGEYQQWPLVSDRLFTGKGEYARQIRSVLSGGPYPASIVIRKPDAGGGDVVCHLQVACSSLAIGSDGRVKIDYRAPDLGIFVGGVALLGQYV